MTHHGGLTEKLGTSHQVANSHVEVSVATAPVGDLGEGVGGQQFLGTKQRVEGENHYLNLTTTTRVLYQVYRPN